MVLVEFWRGEVSDVFVPNQVESKRVTVTHVVLHKVEGRGRVVVAISLIQEVKGTRLHIAVVVLLNEFPLVSESLNLIIIAPHELSKVVSEVYFPQEGLRVQRAPMEAAILELVITVVGLELRLVYDRSVLFVHQLKRL